MSSRIQECPLGGNIEHCGECVYYLDYSWDAERGECRVDRRHQYYRDKDKQNVEMVPFMAFCMVASIVIVIIAFIVNR